MSDPKTEALAARVRLLERRIKETIPVLEAAAERELARENGAAAFGLASMASVFHHLLAEASE